MSTPNKQPRTLAQIEASRANGAKSHGPITPAGRTVVSKNRMTHGFRSGSIVLTSEEAADYDARLDSYRKRYAPVDQVEEDLVGLLASNMWQIMRANSIELAHFELEISGVDVEGQFEDMDQYGILALAFRKSAGDNVIELLRRYKNTAERAYYRAFESLEQILKDRDSKPSAPAPEPEENFSTVQTRESPIQLEDPPPDPSPEPSDDQPKDVPLPLNDAPNPQQDQKENVINRTQPKSSLRKPQLVLVPNPPRPATSQPDVTPDPAKDPPCTPKS